MRGLSKGCVVRLLRLALKKGMITTNGGFFNRHDLIELPTAPKVTGYCERCNERFDVPEEHLECPVCGSKEKVHLIASRDVAEVLRLALKKGMITTNGGFFKRHDPIELLLSTAHYGTTSCILLDVLNETTTSIRIVAAMMHSPMDVYKAPSFCVSSRF
jgi:Zn finger protein HypA/HybF involved in hydrogenase expression